MHIYNYTYTCVCIHTYEYSYTHSSIVELQKRPIYIKRDLQKRLIDIKRDLQKALHVGAEGKYPPPHTALVSYWCIYIYMYVNTYIWIFIHAQFYYGRRASWCWTQISSSAYRPHLILMHIYICKYKLMDFHTRTILLWAPRKLVLDTNILLRMPPSSHTDWCMYMYSYAKETYTHQKRPTKETNIPTDAYIYIHINTAHGGD